MLQELLVAILLGSKEFSAAATAGIKYHDEWHSLVQCAYAWAVLPLLYERCHLPSSAKSECKQLITEGYIRSFLEAKNAVVVLSALQAEKIRIIAIKGLVSIALLFGDSNSRVMHDADLLVHPHDLIRTVRLIKSLGFRPAIDIPLKEYSVFTQHAPGFSGNKELSFYNDRGNTIDLHWGLGEGLDIPTLLARAQKLHLFGIEFSATSSIDGILVCVHHSLRNHFNPARIMRDLIDLNLWLSKMYSIEDFELTIQESHRARLFVPLLAMTRLLTTFDPKCEAHRIQPYLTASATKAQHKSALKLQELFHSQVTEGQIDHQILYLFRSYELKLILTGLLNGRFNYLKARQSMDSEKAGRSVLLIHRFGTMAKAALRLRPHHIRLLRNLAHVKNTYDNLI